MVKHLAAALAKLPEGQRKAIMLVGAEGMSYEAAAQALGCAVGTIQSRVNRARNRLAELMGLEWREQHRRGGGAAEHEVARRAAEIRRDQFPKGHTREVTVHVRGEDGDQALSVAVSMTVRRLELAQA